MILKRLIYVLVFVAMTGCAAGMRGVHTGTIEANSTVIQKLGPISEDTDDEARRRELHWNNIENALSELAEYYPAEAEQWRKTVSDTLGDNPYK